MEITHSFRLHKYSPKQANMKEEIAPEDDLPANMTLAEAAEFWDEHSALDYEFQEVHFVVEIKKRDKH